MKAIQTLEVLNFSATQQNENATFATLEYIAKNYKLESPNSTFLHLLETELESVNVKFLLNWLAQTESKNKNFKHLVFHVVENEEAIVGLYVYKLLHALTVKNRFVASISANQIVVNYKSFVLLFWLENESCSSYAMMTKEGNTINPPQWFTLQQLKTYITDLTS